MQRIPLINLPLQYKNLKKKIDPAMLRVIEKGAFILGEELSIFETEFAKYLGAKYCFGVSSGSTALDLALKAIDIKAGDEVICPTLTFTATAEAIVHMGATPIFVDIDKNTYNIDKDQITQKITKKTKAIITVHMYGQITDMDNISKIAKNYNLPLIEDAAQAHGATYNHKMAGAWGDAACFSFYPSKNLGCFGDGGAVVTNNKKIAEKIGLLRDHGRISKYDHKIVGYDGRLDNLQAAVLRVKLKYLDQWNKRKRQIAKFYTGTLSEKYIKPFTPAESNPIYYVYTLQHPQRNQIMQLLNKKGIASAIYYPIPLHLLKAYSDLNYKKGDFPVAEKTCSSIFSIPIYPELSKDQIDYIVKTLNEVAKGLT